MLYLLQRLFSFSCLKSDSVIVNQFLIILFNESLQPITIHPHKLLTCLCILWCKRIWVDIIGYLGGEFRAVGFKDQGYADNYIFRIKPIFIFLILIIHEFIYSLFGGLSYKKCTLEYLWSLGNILSIIYNSKNLPWDLFNFSYRTYASVWSHCLVRSSNVSCFWNY